MASPRRNQALRHLRTLFNVGTVAGLTDAQLLNLFVARRGEAAELAFAALIERHGAMVLRACRGVLRNPHDAEDAFQATFLVLARKAGALHRPGSLAGWLYGVALRVAARARAARGRRRKHEQRWTEMTRGPTSPGNRDDIRPVLHEELGRLPERYRTVVVLCDLEDKSYAEAARELGCSTGTVGSRLTRGRERLRNRLARRGLAPAVVAALAEEAEAVSAALPPALVDATLTAATRFAAGSAVAAGMVPTSSVALAEGVLKAMFLTKLQAVAASVVTLGVITIGTGVLAQSSATAPSPVAIEPDRLEEVERKLDRLLRVLEGPDRRTNTPADPSLPSLPTVSSPESAGASGDVPKGVARAAGAPRGGAQASSGSVRYGVTAPAGKGWGPDRIERLEQRLEQLEKRIEQLENRSGVSSAAP